MRNFTKFLMVMAILFALSPQKSTAQPYTDNFESYTLGGFLALQNPTWWTTWSNLPGTGEDGQISNAFASNGSQSVLLDEVPSASDLVFKAGNKTSGIWEMNFKMYVETGKAGYYNILHSLPSAGANWAYEVYFRTDGTGHLFAGSSTAINFTYPKNTWFQITNHIDINNDVATLYVNGVLVYTWPFHYTSLSTGGGTTVLAGADIFAGAEGSSGESPLFYIDDFNFDVPPPPPGSCTYSIALWDSFGDGWNGCSIDVLVDGVTRLDNITLPSGSGPLYFYFPANVGAMITTTFAVGSWACEPYYYVYDSEGNQVWYVPPGYNGCNPVIFAGQLYGTCPIFGDVEGYVFNYDGLAISGAIVGEQGGPTATTGPNGYYFLPGVTAGQTPLSAGKAGYNITTDIVTVLLNDTVQHNFTLTQPNMVINPLYIEETLNPNEFFTTSLNVLNNGNGPLDYQATINLLTVPIVPCEYSINLYDSYGDGWNGCSLDVLVNGVVVLNNITLNSGQGPVTFYFPVVTGDEITTVFNTGSYPNEPYYYIYNSLGAQVWYAPNLGSGPGNIMPGQLYAACSGGVWLTMDNYTGTVPPFGGVDNIPTHLDAANTSAGEVYTGEVIFTSNPNVATITVPVTMIIMGAPLVAPQNLTATLANDITGDVSLTWEWNGDSFQFFMVKRDGVIIGTTTNLNFTDILPDFGNYCYTVQAVYDEGQTSPAGPACIEWPNPAMFINPTSLEGWVWVNNQVKVYTTISNTGIGTLHYTFPDFAASANLSASSTINLPAGPATAPKNTAVAAGGTFKARPESTYTVNRGQGGRADLTVLLLAADPASVIHNLLEGYGDLAAVDYIDARYTTPTLGQLQQYNVVVTWSNYTYSSASGMGNVLADYVDAGGRVINLMFGLDPNWGLQGRFVNEGYTAMTGSGTNYSTSCLGTYDPTHPIMEGISSVCDYYRLANPSLTSGSTTIAKWSDNSIFVAVKDDNTVVSIGGYVGDSYQYSGQMPDVLHNAILWVSGGGNFIVAVNPASANVAAGESQVVEITYDATGFDPGTYTEDLVGESNDPAHLDFIIGNTMHVYIPAQFAGNVYDVDDGNPFTGVIVTAGPFQTTTNEEGMYSMYVDEGTYNVVFQKLGYMTVTVADTMALQGVVTPVSVGMWDNNYAPGFVHAEVMDNDTWCEVTWTFPEGPYEIIMDDGEADDYFIWASAGNMNAVKFTPARLSGNSYRRPDLCWRRQLPGSVPWNRVRHCHF